MFEAKVPARKFRGYRCTIHDYAQEKTTIPVTANSLEGAAIGKPIADMTVEMVEDVQQHHHIRKSHEV